MRMVDLFSGIGGFSLAASWCWGDDLEILTFCEIEEFPQKVLKKNFPGVPIHDDIHTLDAAKWRGSVDLICGGFPCQPFSIAGKQEGAGDDRYLWPEMLRVIREACPRWVIAENVGGLVAMQDGMVFDDVCASLEAEGYQVITFIIPACAVNAPHRRDRVWIVAHCESAERKQSGDSWERGSRFTDCNLIATNAECTENGDAADAFTARKRRSEREEEVARNSGWDEHWFQAATRFCGIFDGVSNRVDRLKGLGNAIVPQVAFQIMQAIRATKK